VIAISPRYDHKAVLIQRVRLQNNTEVAFIGCNLDPGPEYKVEQTKALHDEWVMKNSTTDFTIVFGDINNRIQPSEGIQKGAEIESTGELRISASAAEEIAALISTEKGRLELLKRDQLQTSSSDNHFLTETFTYTDAKALAKVFPTQAHAIDKLIGLGFSSQ
jgi:hypothetical protein